MNITDFPKQNNHSKSKLSFSESFYVKAILFRNIILFRNVSIEWLKKGGNEETELRIEEQSIFQSLNGQFYGTWTIWVGFKQAALRLW
jgi:hypothetical protein